jgi:hypothetical protein
MAASKVIGEFKHANLHRLTTVGDKPRSWSSDNQPTGKRCKKFSDETEEMPTPLTIATGPSLLKNLRNLIL